MEIIYKKIYLFDFFLIFVSVFSLINIFLLSIEYFYPLLSLLFTLVLLIAIFFLFRLKIELKDKRFGVLFLAVIVLALALRFSPNLYLTGGQDQGTYVSLSKQYELNHSLYVKDELRVSLSDSQKKIYDKGNLFLGIKFENKEESRYVMPFYPVFPSWMATFGNLFGSDNRIYALTLFSILSIVGVYLLSYEIAGRNKKVGLLASFLLAINPLHVYFSRIPLTEIVALTFMCFGFYFLIRFYNDYKKKNVRFLNLIVSLLMFSSLFYTRMSGIFFLPIIILIPLLTFLFLKDKKLIKYFVIYSGLWVFSLILSYIFYKNLLPNLYNQILNKRLFELLGTNVISSISIISALFIGGVIFVKRIREFLKKVLAFIGRYIFIIALIVFFALIAYELYFYIKDIFIDNHYKFLSNESLSSFKQLSFLIGFLYLSPFGFVLLPLSFIVLGKKIDIKIILLISTILIFLIYCWGVLRITRYHYYFTRYQLSELIPLCTILISIFLIGMCKSKGGRTLSIVLISVMTIYLGYFSVIQSRSPEGLNKEVLSDVKELVGQKDLLFVARNDFESFNQITFPLKYYYDINIFPLYSTSYVDKEEVIQETKKYDNVYLLTRVGTIERDDLKLVKEVDFKNNYFVHCNRSEDAYFEMGGHSKDIPFCKYIIIPNRYYYGTYRLYLYKWELTN